MKKVIGILFAISLSQMTMAPAFAQFETKPTPLWEGVEKTDADKANDETFVKQALALSNGDRQAAVIGAVQLGWQQIGQGQPNDAIRRFNQAWLLNPDFPDLYWGLGVATHIRGDETDAVVRWFEEAFKGLRNNPNFLSDRGRVLEERKLPERARYWFQAALRIDPKNVPAHVGMSRVAKALKDEALEKTHLDQLKQIAPDLVLDDQKTEKTE